MKKQVLHSPQISGAMVSHHDMVSPQNGAIRGAPPPPSDATVHKSLIFIRSIWGIYLQ